MLQAVVFDMGGVIFTATPCREKRLRFAADAIALLKTRGVCIPDAPEAFMEKLEAIDRVRKADNERQMREFPPLECWAGYYLKEYGATEAQLFPIAETLCLWWNIARYIEAPRPGMVECLAALSHMGMRLGIISNTISRTHVPLLLETYGVAHHFESMLLSSVCGLRKPDPRIFRLCESVMNLAPEQMAYVGDTISRDVIGARAAGWGRVIRLMNRNAKQSELVREAALVDCGIEPDDVLESLSELPPLIARLRESDAV